MHQEDGSDGSLSLAVTLVRAKQAVSLQDVEEALLPAHGKAERAFIRPVVSGTEGAGKEAKEARSPVTSSRGKHFVEGKLPMEVALNNVHPGWISPLTQQLLKTQRNSWSLAATFEPFPTCRAHVLEALLSLFSDSPGISQRFAPF